MEAVADDLMEWPYHLLSEEVHSRLVANIDGVAAVAGVPVDMLDRSMKESGCGVTEIDWVKNYPKLYQSPKKGGLIFVGAFKPTATDRMVAMAAAFVRNYVDARLISLFSLLPADGKEADDIDPTVLLIPDFCHGNPQKAGHSFTHWQSQYVYGLVMERFTQRRVTILHVDSFALVEKEYGKTFLDFLQSHWNVIAPK